MAKTAVETADAQAAPEAATVPPSRPLHDLIERWFADHFHGSVVTRDTDAWNVAIHAKDDLKRRMAAFIGC